MEDAVIVPYSNLQMADSEDNYRVDIALQNRSYADLNNEMPY